QLDEEVTTLSQYGKSIINDSLTTLQKVAQEDFDRVIFLGSGPSLGIARESHLKVQELSNGEVLGKFDSFLGFRHGPKAIINDDTLVVYLLSNEEDVKRYENDLIEQIAQHEYDLTTLAITEGKTGPSLPDSTLNFVSQGQASKLWSIFCSLPCQIRGFSMPLLLRYRLDHR